MPVKPEKLPVPVILILSGCRIGGEVEGVRVIVGVIVGVLLMVGVIVGVIVGVGVCVSVPDGV